MHPPLPTRVRRSVRRLLDAIDVAVAASREVEKARDALAKESDRLQRFAVVGADEEGTVAE